MFIKEKNIIVFRKQLKALVILDLALRNQTRFIQKKNSRGNEVKIMNNLLYFINFQIYFLLIT